MTAEYKLRQLILFKATGVVFETEKDIRDAYVAMADTDEDKLADAEADVRGGAFRTGIGDSDGGHYSFRGVGAKMLDGSLVGWVYYYGGGKHGQPSEMPWIEWAYDIVAEVRVEPVTYYKKV